ncbi:hypothetical protein EDB86DRAFT_554132 [Lactarius hatsudake]|nr:hypothetical protein EDB86DRAFT_554132 [Lactarius hatsudake]
MNTEGIGCMMIFSGRKIHDNAFTTPSSRLRLCEPRHGPWHRLWDPLQHKCPSRRPHVSACVESKIGWYQSKKLRKGLSSWVLAGACILQIITPSRPCSKTKKLEETDETFQSVSTMVQHRPCIVLCLRLSPSKYGLQHRVQNEPIVFHWASNTSVEIS